MGNGIVLGKAKNTFLCKFLSIADKASFLARGEILGVVVGNISARAHSTVEKYQPNGFDKEKGLSDTKAGSERNSYANSFILLSRVEILP